MNFFKQTSLALAYLSTLDGVYGQGIETADIKYSEPKTLTSKTSSGELKLTYTSYINTEYKIPRAYIKGKFELTDLRSAAWTDLTNSGDNVRICLTIGTLDKWDDFKADPKWMYPRELIKWKYHPVGNTEQDWDALAYSPNYVEWPRTLDGLKSSSVVSDVKDPNIFCGFAEAIDRKANDFKNMGNNGVLNGKGTYSATDKKATLEWKREFDIPENMYSISLVAGLKYKVLLQWGTFKAEELFTTDGTFNVQGDTTASAA